jgi:hypothetical protein
MHQLMLCCSVDVPMIFMHPSFSLHTPERTNVLLDHIRDVSIRSLGVLAHWTVRIDRRSRMISPRRLHHFSMNIRQKRVSFMTRANQCLIWTSQRQFTPWHSETKMHRWISVIFHRQLSVDLISHCEMRAKMRLPLISWNLLFSACICLFIAASEQRRERGLVHFWFQPLQRPRFFFFFLFRVSIVSRQFDRMCPLDEKMRRILRLASSGQLD